MGRGSSKAGGGGNTKGGGNKTNISLKDQLAQDISDYLSTQVKLDIDKYRDSTTKGFDTENYINIDYKAMPKTEQQKLNQALNKPYSPFTSEMSGTWMLTIQKKKG